MNKKAFTFIELIVVLTIIVIISTIVYANFEGFNRRGEIMNSAGKVYDNLRTAQAYGVSGRTVGGKVTYGWGVNVDRTTNKEILFTDYNNNGVYDYPTKLLIHGSEEVTGGTNFTESSTSSLLMTISPTGAATEDGGKPTATSKFWSFVLASSGSLSNNSFSPFLGPSSFALDMWFKLDTFGGIMTLVKQGGQNPPFSFHLYKDNNDKINFDFYGQGPTPYQLQSAIAVTSTTSWYHVAAVRDNSKGILQLFLGIDDGINKTVSIVSSTPIISSDANPSFNGVWIGQNGGNSGYWNGDMDDIRLIVGTPYYSAGYSFPTTESKTDEELVKTLRLPPGVVFQRLFNNLTPTNSANILWRINDPSHYTWVDNVIASSTVIVNHAGAENSGTDRDTPATTTIGWGGVFNKFGF